MAEKKKEKKSLFGGLRKRILLEKGRKGKTRGVDVLRSKKRCCEEPEKKGKSRRPARGGGGAFVSTFEEEGKKA